MDVIYVYIYMHLIYIYIHKHTFYMHLCKYSVIQYIISQRKKLKWPIIMKDDYLSKKQTMQMETTDTSFFNNSKYVLMIIIGK